MKCNCTHLEDRAVELFERLKKAEADAIAWQESALDFKANCMICHKVVADKNQETTKLKAEREGLQVTIRSLKMRGE